MKSQVNVTGWYKEKIAQNYRQIFNVDKIDYCSMIKTADSLPWFSYFIDWAKAFLPGLVRVCPVTGVSS
jgi:hypothetical protein